MKLATQPDGTDDGRLIVVSRDLTRAVLATAIAPSLLVAVQRWDAVAPALQILSDDLHAGRVASFAFEPISPPLPRAPQWLDASAFLQHGRLMQQAFNTPEPPDFTDVPMMYQGASDDFLGPLQDVPLPDATQGMDFEGEFGVIVGDVPMGVSAGDAGAHIRLLVTINDWSLRALGPREMKTGFGFLQAKPSTSFSPVAITPDELSAGWDGARVHLPLRVDLNGAWFGAASGSEMQFSFGQLIAHAARTRRLRAGTIIGSGTVSNASADAGSSCLAERRVIEIIAQGSPSTPFLAYGDRVRIWAEMPDGSAPFGHLDQRVVPG